MVQPLGAILGGVHKCTGQTKGQSMNPGRRGFKGPRLGLWDPLWWSQSTTKVGGVTGYADAQGRVKTSRFQA